MMRTGQESTQANVAIPNPLLQWEPELVQRMANFRVHVNDMLALTHRFGYREPVIASRGCYQLRHAKEAQAKAITLANDVATLYTWMREDILAVAGPDYPNRRALLDFVVAELVQREDQCEHRIRPVRTLLVNQGANRHVRPPPTDPHWKESILSARP